MHIGIDGRPLQEKFGGVKEYTFNLLHALFSLDQKNEYHIFYNSFGNPPAGGNLPNFSKFSDVHTHRFHWPNKLLNLSMRLFSWPRLDKLINYSCCHPDPAKAGKKSHISNQSYEIPRRLTAPRDDRWGVDLFFLPNLNFAAFSSSFKYIVTVHDLSFHHFPEFYSLKQQLWHKAINYKKLLQQANKIISVSEHTKNDVIETFKIPPNKINVVYPFVDLKPVSNSHGRENLTPIPKNYILYLGTLEPRKNIESIVEAYKLLKKSPSSSPFDKGGEIVEDLPKLVIAGPKGWRYKSIFKTADGEKNIIFLEQVSEGEKNDLYQNAKLFIFPSFYEGFGLPPLEAASFGVPVIASTAASLPEVLGDVAFYVNPWNVQELAEAIKLLLSNENLRQTLSEKGKQRAAKFNAQSSAQKLLNIFEMLG